MALRRLVGPANAAGDAFAIVFDGFDLVTFFPDGRVKIRTNGRNTFPMLERINQFLPVPYRVKRVRERGTHGARLFDGNRVVANFLSSTVFTPMARPAVAVTIAATISNSGSSREGAAA